MQNVPLDKEISKEYPGVGNDEIDVAALFKNFFQTIRRNIALISAVIFGSLLIGVVMTMLVTPKYRAQTKIMIEDQADQIVKGSELQSIETGRDTHRFLKTQVGIIQSRTLARFAVQSAKLDKNTNFFNSFGVSYPKDKDFEGKDPSQARQDQAVDILTKNVDVSLPADSRIATITITSQDPKLSAKIANLYAERFIEYNLNQKYESSAYARQFLGDQLTEARAKLTQSETDLNQYARQAGLIRVTSKGDRGTQESALSVTNDTLQHLNQASSVAASERIAAKDRWNTVAGQPALSIPDVNSNPAIQQLIGEKARLQGALAQDQARYLDGHDTVVSKRAQIDELDARIKQLAETLKKGAQLEYKAALEREKSLNARVQSLREEALGEQDRGVQYSVLKRVADTNRTIYETLLSRYNEISAGAGASTNNVTIVDRAEIPLMPSSPKLLLNLAIALVLGMLIAGLITFLREIFDDAIRSPEDVERKLNMRLLGLVPNLKDGEDIDEKLSNRVSNVSEAYRSLVTNLRYSTATGLPQLMAIASSRAGEGKSTTARAIARDIANQGKKVLLVDMDLRRPTLHRKIGAGHKPGVTDLLIGNKSFDDVLIHSENEMLDYITALPTPPDPALILSSESVASFFEEARSRYDLVLIDSAPLLGLSDAVLLASHADGVLFVIDGSGFHRGAVKSALRRLALINANILGVVLNRFEPRTGDADYKYYGYNYYSYGTDEK